MRDHTPQFLKSGPVKLLLFGGKGGVGKTTCAVAAALDLARADPASSLLLVSTDPAHSLFDSLAGAPLPDNLKVQEIDAGAAVSRFKAAHGAQLREIAVRGTVLDPDDVTRLLDLSLPGFDEVMAFHEIATLIESGIHARIIVDTAPTGHTLRLLAMPKFLRNWLGVLDAMLEKHRYLATLYRGDYLNDEVDDFLAALTALLERVNRVLTDDRLCQFVPVMLAERLSINETGRLLKSLRRWRIPVTDIVVNRLCPFNPICRRCREAYDQQQRELRRAARWSQRYALWGVTDQGKEVRGSESLNGLWNDLCPVTHSDVEPRALAPIPPNVLGPPPLPPREARVMIFAGKGGVGKTTLATATALRLVRDRDGPRVLLFSTDPAHSLSDCLGMEIGAQETPIVPRLTALEIDAQVELKALRRLHAAEIKALFGATTKSAGASIQYDREVFQRVLDLAPPGLDETMALTRAIELLESRRYDTLILDAAPTGHLLRLLELPDQIQDWLKVLFSLFLKHNVAPRLPRMSAFLVTLSQRLKRLQAILASPDQGRLYAVTILTEMALENTRDLLSACRRLGVSVPHIFINLATPPSECPLCVVRIDSEWKVKNRLVQSLAHYPRSTVYQCTEPRGVARLAQLGDVLYASPTSVVGAPDHVLVGDKDGH
jgi:arsenite-transporting ATPase